MRPVHEMLLEFVGEEGNVLLIKGGAGTGKTTLALTLLKGLGKRGVYFSSRVSYDKLVNQFPWAKSFLRSADVISLQTPPPPARVFEDVRVSDAKHLLNEVLRVLMEAGGECVFVFDTWDAIAKELELTERLKVEKALISAIEGRGSSAIFVSEEPERTTLDYVVDGVLTLRERWVGHWRVREMVVEKLRGYHVVAPTRLFTLRDALFTELPLFEYRISEKPVLFKPFKPPEGYHSTGSRDLDGLLGGGFKKGSVSLIEIDPGINRIVLAALLTPVVLSFIEGGGRASLGVAPDMDEEAVLRHVRPYASPGSLGRLKLARGLNELKMLALESSREGPGFYVGFDAGLADLEEELDTVLEICRLVREGGGVLVIVSSPAVRGFERLVSLADLHFVLWQEGGYMLLREKRVPIGVHAVSFTVERGVPEVRLVEVT